MGHWRKINKKVKLKRAMISKKDSSSRKYNDNQIKGKIYPLIMPGRPLMHEVLRDPAAIVPSSHREQ